MADLKIYTIYGGIGSGKTSLAKRLSEHFLIPHLSSDQIRQDLTGSPNGKTKHVFTVMRAKLSGYLSEGLSVILDSTGQSPSFRQLIDDYQILFPMFKIQLNCDYETWKNRENIRDDRFNLDDQGSKVNFEMPERAFYDSNAINLSPDLQINTSNMSADDVFKTVIDHIHNNPKE
jgi:predicted kinase